jgi:hypothetical protein
MAEAIEALRMAFGRAAARQVGLREEQPMLSVAQQRLMGDRTDLFALPQDTTDWLPLQDITPGSHTFGQFFFLPDYDTPGEATMIVR